MLALEQKDAFSAFRRQISRENVAKDFNRFQQLAFIGADAARAWQQIAFLHQCVELEGNARWWHYLNLLGIECEHKAFQSERRDLQYIRGLVPQLITRSSYDFYTVLEFTRHYQIDDSYPSLLYVEALLMEEDASSGSLEYHDRIVGVLEDIHDQHLISLLLKTLSKISGTDYDRLQFVFRLLLEHTTYAGIEEVERRIEVLHILKAHNIFLKKNEAKLQQRSLAQEQAAGQSSSLEPSLSATPASSDSASTSGSICFHDIIAKPREVLTDLLTAENYNTLAGIAAPLRLEPDELEIILLKNMVQRQLRGSGDAEKAAQSRQLTVNSKEYPAASSLAKFSAFKPVLERLTDTESRVTAAEWLAENFPLGDEKVQALEFALRAAKADVDSRNGQGQRGGDCSSSATFTGAEALARLESKILRASIEMLLRSATAEDPALLTCFSDAATVSSLMKLLGHPRDLFLEIYRRFALRCFHAASHALHDIADKLATLFGLSAAKLRLDLVREWLIQDAVRKPPSRPAPSSARGSDETMVEEDPFQLLEDEVLGRVDEQYIQRTLFVATRCVRDDVPGAGEVLKYLVRFANETKPRAGVTFRAKVRALRVAFRLGQMNDNPVIARYTTATFGAGNENGGFKDLLRYTTHCAHMVALEEHRVPIEMDYFLTCDKEALVCSLLRQFPDRERWVLRCMSHLLLDFDVQRADLWDVVLAGMRRRGMFRSLASVLAQLSRRPFVRSLENAAEVWEQVLKHPMTVLRRRLDERSFSAKGTTNDKKPKTACGTDVSKASSGSDDVAFVGAPVQEVRAALSRMVLLLQKCPFLDCIDVPSFVVQLGDLTTLAEAQEDLRAVIDALDLYGTAVRCAMVIPKPSTRLQALVRIVEAGAYMPVLHELADVAYVLNRDHLLIECDEERGEEGEEGEGGDFSEQLRLVQAAFGEAVRRRGSEAMRDLLDSPFELGFIEFYTATCAAIDPLVAILYAYLVLTIGSACCANVCSLLLKCGRLSEKRLNAASTAVELWYELHPAVTRPVIVDDASGATSTATLVGTDDDPMEGGGDRWAALKAFVAASTSPELAPFRAGE